MHNDNCIAMILAGGRGERLGSLTDRDPKPAVPFGTGYRIIDFTLSNCVNSGVRTVGILGQYCAEGLRSYIQGLPFRSADNKDGMVLLPSGEGRGTYRGTADAVYKNFAFIERVGPRDVLVLSCDHVYMMDYRDMLAAHRESGADITLAVKTVQTEDAPRFGMVTADSGMAITGFQEKPRKSRSTMASMGVYLFKWDALRTLLSADAADAASQHDFGGNVLPGAIKAGVRVCAYGFDGYWQDIGTVTSLWQANMDMLRSPKAMGLLEQYIRQTPLQADAPIRIDQFEGICNSLVSGRCDVRGIVENSVIATGAHIGENAIVAGSVIMDGAYIGKNAIVSRAVIGPGARVLDGAYIGADQGIDEFVDKRICAEGVTLVAPGAVIDTGTYVQCSSHVNQPYLSYTERPAAAPAAGAPPAASMAEA